MPEKTKPESRRAAWIIPFLIFTCAFAVRIIFVLQVKDSSYWRVPLVDAGAYDKVAGQMLDVSWLAPIPTADYPYAPYFQPPFYHAFLALLYLITGRSILGAIIIQYAVGSLCCVLTYFLGRRFFDERVGAVAGVAMAFTASQIFYEGRLLPPVLITLLNLVILLLAANRMKSPSASGGWRWPVIGLLLGLSAITRPDILLFVPAFLVWMWIERRTLFPERPRTWTAIVLAGLALPIALVGLRNLTVGNDFAWISTNGGVNFMIGNHPEMEKMLGIRPGIEWDSLTYSPTLHGAITPSDASRYFYRQAFEMMGKYKPATISNLGRKLLWVWRGQEIKRNEDDYYLTRTSALYRALLWRVGRFGFPFGVIAPFALLGMVVCFRRRRELFLLYAYVGTQVLMLVAFFPCSRYRAPMMPILLIFGAAAAFELISVSRRKEWGRLLALAGLLAAFGIVATLSPPRFEGTPKDREAENYWLLATAYAKEDRLDECITSCQSGLALAPANADLRLMLMYSYHANGDFANAEKEALKCLKLAPRFMPIYMTLLEIYEAQSKYDKAEEVRVILDSSQPRQ